ncbi:IPT/TIG domain-containing protein [Cerasicoccus maritimus]|uniref:IPT/TIG domain-containing protein n=1 Tax=Cerasicoccus maritimus TaxID=490089 RepID=UPI002852A913|nr:IPT/TIG domain-containing protein [Cerasicoccus maritimus]
MKAKLYLILAATAALLTGCGPSINNLTSERVPQNASGIYTLSMTVTSDDGAISTSSYAPKVVIDGVERDMIQSDVGKNIFEYDYAIPEGRTEAKYYYLLDYKRDNEHYEKSKIYLLNVTDRYVTAIESVRGPVGAEIPVVGRGFTDFDKIVIGGFEADTTYQSPTSLTFIVPALKPNQAYRAELVSGNGVKDLGKFHVDASKLTVVPSIIRLNPGERTSVAFGVEYPTSGVGLPISVMTNVPDSVIMPEVAIPAGARSVSIPIEGGKKGSGLLYVTAPGYNELQVPVFVGMGSGSTTDWQYPPAGSSVNDQPKEVIIEEETSIIEIFD